MAVVEDEAFEVAGEQEDRRDGQVTSRYSRIRRRSSSLIADELIVTIMPSFLIYWHESR